MTFGMSNDGSNFLSMLKAYLNGSNSCYCLLLFFFLCVCVCVGQILVQILAI